VAGSDAVSEKPYRILVVDDEPDLLILLEEHLRQEGYDVLTATTGMQAITKAREERPDIILLDVMMPGVSGFDVCNILQDFPETADIPVIFLTAVAETKRKVMGLNLGADDYITKPFDLHELAARVQAALRPRIAQHDANS
jgi:DNA-binding response OmpR family regulator